MHVTMRLNNDLLQGRPVHSAATDAERTSQFAPGKSGFAAQSGYGAPGRARLLVDSLLRPALIGPRPDPSPLKRKPINTRLLLRTLHSSYKLYEVRTYHSRSRPYRTPYSVSVFSVSSINYNYEGYSGSVRDRRFSPGYR